MEPSDRSDSERVREAEGMLDALTRENNDLRRQSNELEQLTTTRRQKQLVAEMEATRAENAAVGELKAQLKKAEEECSEQCGKEPARTMTQQRNLT
jgi:dynactin complex subunit